MQATSITLGAKNYLQQFFGVDSVSKLNSQQALSLCEDSQIDPEGEANELWVAYIEHHGLHGLGAGCSPEKFLSSKFYREHM